MKRSIILFAFALIFSYALIAAPINEAEEDAVFLEMEKQYTLNSDGSWRFDYAHRVKLITHQSVTRGLGETFIVFNPQYQKLVVDKSVTTMADGKIVPSPDNAFNDVLPSAVNDAPDYAHLVERVISHTGLERGCAIDLRYHMENSKDFIPWMWGEELFGARYPIADLRVIVQVPQDVTLHFALLNSDEQPTITTESGFRRYTWSGKNVPALSTEDHHQAFEDFVPRLVFSTCPSWQALRDYLAKELTAKSLPVPTFIGAVRKSCDAIDPMKRLMQWRRTISEEIATISPSPAWLGFRFADLSRVVARGYGQEIEKALLLTVIAREENIPAQVAYLSTGRSFAASVPTLLQFRHPVVALPGQKETLYLPVVNNPARLLWDEYPGRTVFFIQGEGEPLTTLTQTADDHLRLVAQLKLTATDKIQGQVQLTAGGYFLPYLQLMEADGQKKFAADLIRQILPNGKTEGVSLQYLHADRVVLTATYHSDEFFKKMAYDGWYTCAGINSIFDAWRFTPHLRNRVTPIAFPSAFDEEVIVEISAPDSLVWRVPQSPAATGREKPQAMHKDIRNDLGLFTLAIVAAQNTVTFTRKCAVQKREISMEQYHALKRLLCELQDANQRTCYLSRR